MPTADIGIVASADDALHDAAAHGFSSISASFAVGDDGLLKHGCQARFLNVGIPVAATIVDAYLVLQARAAGGNFTCNAALSLELINNAEQITSDAEFDAAILTPTVTWSSIPTQVIDDVRQTPSLTAQVQEVIDLVGWGPENAINVFMVDAGSTPNAFRDFYSWDDDPDKAPVLHLEWINPPAFSYSSGPITAGAPARTQAAQDDGQHVLDLQSAVGADDVRHREDHTFQITVNEVIVGKLANLVWGCAMRFLLDIPQGVVIDAAYLTFVAAVTRTGTVMKTSIYLHSSDDSEQIIDDPAWHDVVENLTGAFAAYDDIVGWPFQDEFQSPSIIAPLQEVINRPGWDENNAINILWLDNGSTDSAVRQPYSFEGAGEAPKLHIEFTTLVHNHYRTEPITAGQPPRLIPPPQIVSGILDVEVAAGEDDVRHKDDHVLDTTGTLIFGNIGGTYGIAMLFNLGIPFGSSVQAAYITFTSFGSAASVAKLKLDVEDVLNPGIIVDDPDWHTRLLALVGTPVLWDPVEAWVNQQEHLSPDISPLILERVNTPEWSEGSKVNIFVLDDGSSGSGFRQPYSKNGGFPPSLHVEFTPPVPSHYRTGDITAGTPKATQPGPAPQVGGTLDLQISDSADDTTLWEALHIYINSIELNFGDTTSPLNNHASLRFLGVTIPAGFIITNSFFTFIARATKTGADTHVRIQAHKADNSPQVTSDVTWHAIIDSNLTTAFDDWNNIEPWTNTEEYFSISFNSVIQEMLDGGFLDSGVLHLFILNNGSSTAADNRRIAWPSNVEPAKAAKLHIEWEPAPAHAHYRTGPITAGVSLPS